MTVDASAGKRRAVVGAVHLEAPTAAGNRKAAYRDLDVLTRDPRRGQPGSR